MEARPRAMYLSHGGGPCFFMREGSRQTNQDSDAAKWYRSFARKWSNPRAIVVVSAHWEEYDAVAVTSGAKHPLLFDYYGFPDYTYDLKYDCPGDPELAERIIGLLHEERITTRRESRRGYDHGVFIPLKLMYPEANIPVVQVSLLGGLSAEKHLKIGEALRRLAEDEDLLLVGSGQVDRTKGWKLASRSRSRWMEIQNQIQDGGMLFSREPRVRRRFRAWKKAAARSRGKNGRNTGGCSNRGGVFCEPREGARR